MKAIIDFKKDLFITYAFGMKRVWDLKEEMGNQSWDDAWLTAGYERDDLEGYFELDFNIVWDEGEEVKVGAYPVIDGAKFHCNWEECEVEVIGERKEYYSMNENISKDIKKYLGRTVAFKYPYPDSRIELKTITEDNVEDIANIMLFNNVKMVLKPLEDVLKDEDTLKGFTIIEAKIIKKIIELGESVTPELCLTVNSYNILKNKDYDVHGFINKGYAIRSPNQR